MIARFRLLPSRLRAAAASHPNELIALVAFGLSAYLVSSSFSPNLDEIGAWDEATFVNTGRRLFEGSWPSFAENPLVALVYMILYLPFVRSEYWLVYTTSAGRVVMFALVWLSATLVARQLARWTHPLIMVGLLMVSSIPLLLFKFPSDPLFVAMAGFSFSKLLAFHNALRLRDLALASFFLGLAALSRNDGLVMGPILVFLAGVVAFRHVAVWKAVLTASGPFVAVVFGYVLVAGGMTGDYGLGTGERAYDNFEAGQQIVFTATEPLADTLEAKLEARRLFGTPEQNDNSIFRAILRNPNAYMDRLERILRLLPGLLLTAYGQRLAVLLLLLAARGGWELWRRRERRLLAVLLLWPMHLASGFAITLFRLGHLRFPFYVVYALAAIGLAALLANRGNGREQRGWTAVLLAAGVASVAVGAPAVQMGVVGFGVGLVLLFWIWPLVAGPTDRNAAPVFGLVFLCIGLILHGDFPGPGTRTLGERPDEQAVVFLQRNFPPGTPVAATAPGPIYAARMTYMGLTALDIPLDLPSEEFIDWMREGGIEVVYVDHNLVVNTPELWEKIAAGVGSELERVFVAGAGDIQILRLVP